MSAPEVVVLDTRGATDKAEFLSAAARSLDFPDYQGKNWDAFEESLRDFVADRGALLVVWTGASELATADREVALEIMESTFTDAANLLIVDDVTLAAQPDFALDAITLAIPADGEDTARDFWSRIVGLTEEREMVFAGEAVTIALSPDPDFQPATTAGPTIMVRDLVALLSRLEIDGWTDDLLTADPFGNAIRFVKY